MRLLVVLEPEDIREWVQPWKRQVLPPTSTPTPTLGLHRTCPPALGQGEEDGDWEAADLPCPTPPLQL